MSSQSMSLIIKKLPAHINVSDVYDALYDICLVDSIVIVPHPLSRFNRLYISVAEWNNTEFAYDCFIALCNGQSVYRSNYNQTKYLEIWKNNMHYIPQGFITRFNTPNYSYTFEENYHYSQSEFSEDYISEDDSVDTLVYSENVQDGMEGDCDIQDEEYDDVCDFIDPITGESISYKELIADNLLPQYEYNSFTRSEYHGFVPCDIGFAY